MNNKKTKKTQNIPDSRLAFVLVGAVILAVIFIAAIIMTNPPESPGPDDSSIIRIGAIYNLNGTQSALDIPSAQGAQVAVQEINENGGIGGKKIRLFLYDGGTDPEKIRESANRLIKEDHVVAIIGMSDSDMVLPAARVAAASGRVFVTSGATSPWLPDEVPGYLYLACFGDNAQAAASAEYARQDLGASTAYIIADDSMQFTRMLSGYFAGRFTQGGGTISGNMSYAGKWEPGQKPMTTLKELSVKPDVIFVACGPQDCGAIVHDIRQAGISVPVLGGDSFDSQDLIAAVGPGAGRIIYTTHGYISSMSPDPAVRSFAGRYKQAFGQEPTAFAGLGYDTVNVLALAINNTPSSGDLRNGLSAIDGYDGLTGTISYKPQERIPVKSVTLMEINNGTVSFVGERVPVQVPDA